MKNTAVQSSMSCFVLAVTLVCVGSAPSVYATDQTDHGQQRLQRQGKDRGKLRRLVQRVDRILERAEAGAQLSSADRRWVNVYVKNKGKRADGKASLGTKSRRFERSLTVLGPGSHQQPSEPIAGSANAAKRKGSTKPVTAEKTLGLPESWDSDWHHLPQHVKLPHGFIVADGATRNSFTFLHRSINIFDVNTAQIPTEPFLAIDIQMPPTGFASAGHADALVRAKAGDIPNCLSRAGRGVLVVGHPAQFNEYEIGVLGRMARLMPQGQFLVLTKTLDNSSGENARLHLQGWHSFLVGAKAGHKYEGLSIADISNDVRQRIGMYEGDI